MHCVHIEQCRRLGLAVNSPQSLALCPSGSRMLGAPLLAEPLPSPPPGLSPHSQHPAPPPRELQLPASSAPPTATERMRGVPICTARTQFPIIPPRQASPSSPSPRRRRDAPRAVTRKACARHSSRGRRGVRGAERRGRGQRRRRRRRRPREGGVGQVKEGAREQTGPGRAQRSRVGTNGAGPGLALRPPGRAG